MSTAKEIDRHVLMAATLVLPAERLPLSAAPRVERPAGSAAADLDLDASKLPRIELFKGQPAGSSATR